MSEPAGATAPTYDPAFFGPLAAVESRHFWFRARTRLITTVATRLTASLPAGYRVLEVGCGTGRVLAALATCCPAGAVVGMDLFLAGLVHARGAAGLVQADLDEPPFAVRFDLVGIFDVLEHLEDDEAVLAKLRALLTDDGRLLVSVPAGRRLWSTFDVAARHRRRYERGELVAKLRAQGYAIDYVTHLFPALYPIARLLRKSPRRTGGDAAGDLAEAHRRAVADLRVVPAINGLMGLLLALDGWRWRGGGRCPSGPRSWRWRGRHFPKLPPNRPAAPPPGLDQSLALRRGCAPGDGSPLVDPPAGHPSGQDRTAAPPLPLGGPPSLPEAPSAAGRPPAGGSGHRHGGGRPGSRVLRSSRGLRRPPIRPPQPASRRPRHTRRLARGPRWRPPVAVHPPLRRVGARSRSRPPRHRRAHATARRLIALVADWIDGNPVGSEPGWEPYPLSRRLVAWSRLPLVLGGDAATRARLLARTAGAVAAAPGAVPAPQPRARRPQQPSAGQLPGAGLGRPALPALAGGRPAAGLRPRRAVGRDAPPGARRRRPRRAQHQLPRDRPPGPPRDLAPGADGGGRGARRGAADPGRNVRVPGRHDDALRNLADGQRQRSRLPPRSPRAAARGGEAAGTAGLGASGGRRRPGTRVVRRRRRGGRRGSAPPAPDLGPTSATSPRPATPSSATTPAATSFSTPARWDPTASPATAMPTPSASSCTRRGDRWSSIPGSSPTAPARSATGSAAWPRTAR